MQAWRTCMDGAVIVLHPKKPSQSKLEIYQLHMQTIRASLHKLAESTFEETYGFRVVFARHGLVSKAEAYIPYKNNFLWKKNKWSFFMLSRCEQVKSNSVNSSSQWQSMVIKLNYMQSIVICVRDTMQRTNMPFFASLHEQQLLPHE